MSGNFAPGDLVVCVETAWWWPQSACATPVKGTVYTVRDVIVAWANEHVGEQHIHLAEIVNEPQNYPAGYGEIWFWSGCFRPVDPRRLEIFRKALTSRPVTEDA